MRPKGTPKTGGRKAGTPNKATADVKALAEPYGQEAITTLAAIMRDTQAPMPSRVRACEQLLDRGYGKPSQAVAVSGGIALIPRSINEYSDDELLEIIASAQPRQ